MNLIEFVVLTPLVSAVQSNSRVTYTLDEGQTIHHGVLRSFLNPDGGFATFEEVTTLVVRITGKFGNEVHIPVSEVFQLLNTGSFAIGTWL